MQVTLESLELAALLELMKLAEPRMSTAEAVFFNNLLSRMREEIAAQIKAQQATAPALETENTAEPTIEAPAPAAPITELAAPAPLAEETHSVAGSQASP